MEYFDSHCVCVLVLVFLKSFYFCPKHNVVLSKKKKWKKELCSHRVSSGIIYSMAIQPDQSSSALGQRPSPGRVTRRGQSKLGRWQKLSVRAKCWGLGNIQSGMWNVEILMKEFWLILLNEVSFACECHASVPTES